MYYNQSKKIHYVYQNSTKIGKMYEKYAGAKIKRIEKRSKVK